MPDRLFDLVTREVARRGGGQAELYERRVRERRYDAREGRIDSLSLSDTCSLAVRVVRNGRMGFSYGFGEGPETVRRMVEAAVFCADASDPDEAYRLPDDASPAVDLPLYDPACETVSDREKAEFACELERRTLAEDPRMKRVRTASLRETVAEVRLRNSDGREASGRESACLATVDAVAEEGPEAQTGYGFGFARRLSDLSLEAIAAEGARRALRMLGARALRTGRVPAILESGAAADLLEVLAPSFLAQNVVKGRSMLSGRIGQAVGAAGVTIRDDPFDPGGSGATAFDGEGCASRTNALVENGVLRRFLADSFWGAKMGTGTTGSCRRASPRVPPSVGPSNLRLSPGGTPPERMRRELGDGVLVTELLGIHTADPVSGDFSVGAAGIRIEGGEEREPVRGFALSGNVLALLSAVVAVGSDFRWFGSTGTPSLAVSGVDVGGE